jgi:hypothetical protein
LAENTRAQEAKLTGNTRAENQPTRKNKRLEVKLGELCTFVGSPAGKRYTTGQEVKLAGNTTSRECRRPEDINNKKCIWQETQQKGNHTGTIQ